MTCKKKQQKWSIAKLFLLMEVPIFFTINPVEKRKKRKFCKHV